MIISYDEYISLIAATCMLAVYLIVVFVSRRATRTQEACMLGFTNPSQGKDWCIEVIVPEAREFNFSEKVVVPEPRPFNLNDRNHVESSLQSPQGEKLHSKIFLPREIQNKIHQRRIADLEIQNNELKEKLYKNKKTNEISKYLLEFVEKFNGTDHCETSTVTYKTVRQLGAGAFATVYLCIDLNNGKEMAKKCVEIGVKNAATDEKVKMIKEEIELYRSIKHKRVVNYYGTMEDSKSISIFMEYMAGGSIHDKISKVGALSEAEVSKYCGQILEGLAYLHKRKIIHRDIKGANILLDGCDNCKLADFNVSRQIQTISLNAGVKSFRGTVYWMSPEVIRGEVYGRKADIWSLGCTALEMLTTKPPWSEYEVVAALYRIGDQPVDIKLPSSTSLACRQFVEACFNREPKMRPSAMDLLKYKFIQK